MLSFIRLAVFTALAAYASATNVITSVTASTNLTPGQPFTITWQTDSSSTVTLILRKGDASNLENIGTIATVPNTGSYTWYPDSDLPGGTDYAFEIVGSDGVPNYSHYFGIDNPSVSAASNGATSAATSGGSSSAAVKTTTLPESLVTDSTIATASGNSNMTSSISAKSSASSRSSAKSGSSASASRTASHSIASATTSSSSATTMVSDLVGGTGLMTLFALSLASMVFCMM